MAALRTASRPALTALGVLTAINLLNYLDRYLVPPLVPELERDVTGLPLIEKLAGLMYANGKL